MALLDQFGFGLEHIAETHKGVDQEIDFFEAFAATRGGAEVEVELNATVTVGNGQHVVTVSVFTVVTGLTDRGNVGVVLRIDGVKKLAHTKGESCGLGHNGRAL